MDTGILESIGLTKSEIRVYLALLDLGSSATGKIVEKSGVASSKIYEILEKLMQKGLASFVIKSGVKHFEAASPDRILDYLNEKEQGFLKRKQELSALLPELKLRKTLTEASETTVFKGPKGAQTAFDDMLNLRKGEEVTCLGHTDLEEWFQRFLLRFHKRRTALGIRMRILHGPRLTSLVEKFKAMGHTPTRQFPQGYQNPAAIFTYRDTTLFSLPYDRLWIQVKNKRLADANRHQFDAMWNQEIRIMRGKDAVQRLIEETLEVKKVWFLGVQAGLSRYSIDLFSQWAKESERKKVEWIMLCDPEAKQYAHRFDIRDPRLIQMKYLTNEVSSPTVIWLYGKTVATVVWGKEPVVTFMENKQIFDHFKKYFDYLWDQDALTLRGFEGIKQLCEKVIETKKDLYLIGANAKMRMNYPPHFEEFEKQRIAHNITRHVLAVEEVKNTDFSKRSLSEIKFLPRHLSSPLVIWIFGDFVAQVIWTQPELVFLVQNRQVADDYRRYFRLLWEKV